MFGPSFLRSNEDVAPQRGINRRDVPRSLEGDCCLTQAEIHAVRQYHQLLAETRGVDVDFQEALEDWQEHHAVKWREERQREYLAKQREEIQRHKWIESEKARRDLGAQAVMDWIRNYAESWRSWYEQEHGEISS
jgi:hypothetical protein